MGKGLLIGGILLGGLALFWGFVLLGIYVLLAAGGDVTVFLPLSMVAFGAGATSIAGGIVGRRRLTLGSVLILLAGSAGLIAPAWALLLNLAADATLTEALVAFMAVGWWAVVMVWLGGGMLLWRARKAGLKGAATGP